MTREWIFGGAVLLVIGASLMECTGCKPAEAPLPPYCYDEAKLTSVLVACASLAPTREEWLTCRRSVNASCGIVVTATDGGVP